MKGCHTVSIPLATNHSNFSIGDWDLLRQALYLRNVARCLENIMASCHELTLPNLPDPFCR